MALPLRFAFFLPAAFALGATPPPAPHKAAAPASAATRTITFAEGTCNTLPVIPISFSIPADYVTRPAATHRTASGCFWGTAADLDRALKDPRGVDFSSIQHGVFWARPAGNVGFNASKNEFFDGQGAGEAAMKQQFERNGAKNAVGRRGSIGTYPTLEFTGDLPAGPNHKAGRLYLLYIGLQSGTHALLINFHRPMKQTPADDQVWNQFIAGLKIAAPPK